MVDIAQEGAPSRWTIAGFGLAILAIWLITRPEPSGTESSSETSSGKESCDLESSDLDSSDQEPSGEDSSRRPAGVGMAALAGV